MELSTLFEEIFAGEIFLIFLIFDFLQTTDLLAYSLTELLTGFYSIDG